MLKKQEKQIQKIKNDTQYQRTMLKSKRRSKRSKISQSFSCQCGKIYLSFSALYLHAKNKHNFKLTTKNQQQAYRVQEKDGFCKYLYNISAQNLKQDRENIYSASLKNKKFEVRNEEVFHQKMIKQNQQAEHVLFKPYIEQLQDSYEKSILKHFISFGCQTETHRQKDIKQQISNFPNKLNQFLLKEINEKLQIPAHFQKWKQTCKILQKFCHWLFKNNLTQLFVINDVN